MLGAKDKGLIYGSYMILRGWIWRSTVGQVVHINTMGRNWVSNGSQTAMLSIIVLHDRTTLNAMLQSQ